MNFGNKKAANMDMIWATGFKRNGRSMNGIKGGQK